MTTAVFYDDTGRIIKVKRGSEDSVKLAINSTGLNYICFDSDVNTDLKFVQDGQLVEFPPPPSKWHKFSFKSKTWRINIAAARQKKSEEINRSRELHELTSFEWDGYTIPSDESNQRYIHSLLRLAQQGDKSAALWLTDNSGTERKFEAQNCIDIGLALCRHVNESHKRARALKLQIKAATTHEELKAIVWE